MPCLINDIFYNAIHDSDQGILLDNGRSIDAEYNTIASPMAFTLQSSTNVIIAHNQLTGGAGLTTSLFQYGILVNDTSSVSIDNNVITNSGPTQSENASSGISLQQCPADFVTGQPLPCNSAIIGNTISVGNAIGIAILSNATGVEVFHNNFIHNMVQAFDQNGQNTWDDGYPDGGNFWSDFTGVDNCSGPLQNICPSPDGIGDTPYVFNFNEDHYPLIRPSA